MKRCIQCKLEKEDDMFCKDKSRKDGFSVYCKDCNNKKSKLYRKLNREKEHLRSINYYEKHKTKRSKTIVRWQKNNKVKVRQIQKMFARKRRKTLMGCLNNRMGSTMCRALNGKKNSRTWESIVNYTIYDLMKHLESKFLPGMSWENRDKWHIDHIIPKTFFVFDDDRDVEFQYCWSLPNLQPLWGVVNIKKRNKILWR